MAKDSTTDGLETVARLLDIVPFLTTHQGIALTELASAFSVSTEQMTKDLTTLWMCGLPGYTPYELIDLSFDSGFVTISNAQTLEKPRALNRDEVLALLLGLESLREDLKESDEHLSNAVSAAISQLTSLVDSAIGKSVQAGNSSGSALMAQCKRAIADGSGLTIRYHSIARDEISERLIYPLEITSDEKFSYVYAFCEFSGGYRTFRLDRVIDFSDTPLTNHSGGELSHQRILPTFVAQVRTRSRQRDIFERLRPSNEISDISDEVQIQCYSPDWIVREVMSLGGAAQVIEPETVKKQISERSRRALGAYARSQVT
ncbi:MAG: WYL domain-containing protein [Actinobacteria bacterium]|nr:WYL domain-containing protein [Actinomycetota bacterium]